jgi:four helix bundle protein
MAFIRRFEEIQGWQEARKLTQNIYRITGAGAFSKDYGLRDQIRRAGVSAMTNVAEGFDCDSKLEFARFLGIARRSAAEVQSLLYVAQDVGYISEAEFHQQYAQAAKTKGLIGALKHSLRPKPTRTITNQRRPSRTT